jgi:hypothetical protein
VNDGDAAAVTTTEDDSSEFLKKNYRYFQEWFHWYDKAVQPA